MLENVTTKKPLSKYTESEKDKKKLQKK